MRLVLRVLFIEFALTWVMLVAGYVRVATQIWPFATARLAAGLRRCNWRLGLGLLVGVPVAVGWPAMFLARGLNMSTHGDWLSLAIPWWVMIGAAGSVVMVAKLAGTQSRARLETGCQCGTCAAYGRVPVARSSHS